MSSLNLSEQEKQFYGEIYSQFDVIKDKKLDFKSTCEFLARSKIDNAQLTKVLEICGAKRVGYFNRSQLYIALKFIALVQNGYSITSSNLSIENLNLPIFYQEEEEEEEEEPPFVVPNHHSPPNAIPSNKIFTRNCCLPPPPPSNHKSSRQRPPPKSSRIRVDVKNPCSLNFDVPNKSSPHMRKNLTPPPRERLTSDTSSPECLDPVEKLMSGRVKTWHEFEFKGEDQRCDVEETGLLLATEDEDQSTLLSNEEDEQNLSISKTSSHHLKNSYQYFMNEEDGSSIDLECIESRQSRDDLPILADEKLDSSYDFIDDAAFASTSQEFISCDADENIVDKSEEEDVWSLSEKQLYYFFDKFLSLKPDQGFLDGKKARNFLEKSKLPLSELKHIWHLADINKDGRLHFAEFAIAVQLIILHRNGVDLPDELPNSLHPKNWKHILENMCFKTETLHKSDFSQLESSNNYLLSPQSKHWTKFNDSPPSSIHLSSSDPSSESASFTLAMPSAKFDQIELDPQMPHPIPVKVSQSVTNGKPAWNSKNGDSNQSQISITNFSIPPPPKAFRASGHARSSSLDLDRKPTETTSVLKLDHSSAFTQYRKHVQQQHLQQLQEKAKNHPLKKEDYVGLLRTKYQVAGSVQFPKNIDERSKHELLELSKNLNERLLLVEMMNELIINELASEKAKSFSIGNGH